MKTFRNVSLSLLLICAVTFTCSSQEQEVIYVKVANQKKLKQKSMKTYLIEREIPDAGNLSAEQLKGISKKSCDVIKEMAPDIEWLHSYIAEDKVYCLYRATSKEAILEHAEKGGFPANNVSELTTKIDPSTAN